MPVAELYFESFQPPCVLVEWLTLGQPAHVLPLRNKIDKSLPNFCPRIISITQPPYAIIYFLSGRMCNRCFTTCASWDTTNRALLLHLPRLKWPCASPSPSRPTTTSQRPAERKCPQPCWALFCTKHRRPPSSLACTWRC